MLFEGSLSYSVYDLLPTINPLMDIAGAHDRIGHAWRSIEH